MGLNALCSRGQHRPSRSSLPCGCSRHKTGLKFSRRLAVRCFRPCTTCFNGLSARELFMRSLSRRLTVVSLDTHEACWHEWCGVSNDQVGSRCHRTPRSDRRESISVSLRLTPFSTLKCVISAPIVSPGEIASRFTSGRFLESSSCLPLAGKMFWFYSSWFYCMVKVAVTRIRARWLEVLATQTLKLCMQTMQI